MDLDPDRKPEITLRELQYDAHELAKKSGWWDGDRDRRNIGELLALVHSEVSEALEEWRSGKSLTEIYWQSQPSGIAKPEGFGVELADVIIRIANLAEEFGIDLTEVVHIKHNFNKSREWRHGGKIA